MVKSASTVGKELPTGSLILFLVSTRRLPTIGLVRKEEAHQVDQALEEEALALDLVMIRM